MSFVIPVGINTADGVTVLPVQPSGSSGTPVVVGTVLPTMDYFFYGTDIQESPGSPTIERAEQCTCQHTMEMNFTTGLGYWSQMGRGTIVSDTAGNIWRILSTSIKRTRALMCELSYSMESISFDSPPDDFSLNEVSLDLNIIKHPRYAWALNPYVTDSSTFQMVGDTPIYYTQIKEAIIRMIQNYTDSPFYPSEAQVQGLIQSNILSMLSQVQGTTTTTIQINYPNKNWNGNSATVDPVPWDGKTADLPTANCTYFVIAAPVDLTNPLNPVTIAVAAAKELISKLWRQEDTPYIAGYEIIWKQYFFQPVFLNPGGYIEDPTGWVPAYFINPYASSIIPRGNQNDVGPIGTGYGNSDVDPPTRVGDPTIFDRMASINPQCYSVSGYPNGNVNFSSLRKSDHYDYERTWFAVSHSWLMAPVGKWDSDIYTQQSRPDNAGQYNQLPSSFGQ